MFQEKPSLNKRLLDVVFFFFSSRRRHTRYIGDWSSDVCSSDLLRSDSPVRGRVRRRAGVQQLLRTVERHGRPRAVERRSLLRQRRLLLDAGPDEIGRASCRERVEISVVAGALKKKKKCRRTGRW